jgi:hypothetical protein
MTKLPALPFPDAQPGQISLVVIASGRSRSGLVARGGPAAAGAEWIDQLAARLALRGALRVLDGGNCFNLYALAVGLQKLGVRPEPALARVRLARAFTCYQMAALLESEAAIPDGEAAGGPPARPTLVLDPLATFFDESVAAADRQRLLRRGLHSLRGLAVQGPVLVLARPVGPPAEAQQDGEAGLRSRLLAALEDAADQVWRFEAHVAPPQPRLF